ncbi:hypothetical protein [Pseudomonas svalbardensis]|uniref:hypothetical protein n=1 Tax=Pseudomonas svalbardensis TaxID=3042029 RepID=UPI0024B33ADE|nr:hypothetical protein [Pseudomonas sp. PMCC200367]
MKRRGRADASAPGWQFQFSMGSVRTMNHQLSSWGHYPSAPQTGHSCAWRNDLEQHLQRLIYIHGTTLPFGNGRSYGDSCLASSDHVLHLRPLNRFIEAETWQVCALNITLLSIPGFIAVFGRYAVSHQPT